jgi:hypothetical protein
MGSKRFDSAENGDKVPAVEAEGEGEVQSREKECLRKTPKGDRRTRFARPLLNVENSGATLAILGNIPGYSLVNPFISSL